MPVFIRSNYYTHLICDSSKTIWRILKKTSGIYSVDWLFFSDASKIKMALLNSVMAYRYLICSCCHKHVPQNNLWLKNSEITRIDFIIWLQPWEVMNHNLEMSPSYFSWPDPGRTSVIEKPRLRIEILCTLQWRHNERDGISNHRRISCLLNRFLRLVSMKTSKLHVTRLCEGNSPVICEFLTQGPVTRQMFPFDDVIMISWHIQSLKQSNLIRAEKASIHVVLYECCTTGFMIQLYCILVLWSFE